jgi:hypothetical protein
MCRACFARIDEESERLERLDPFRVSRLLAPDPDVVELPVELVEIRARPRAVPCRRGATYPPAVVARILDLRRAGRTIDAIAEELEVGRTTAWLVCRQAEGVAA